MVLIMKLNLEVRTIEFKVDSGFDGEYILNYDIFGALSLAS